MCAVFALYTLNVRTKSMREKEEERNCPLSECVISWIIDFQREQRVLKRRTDYILLRCRDKDYRHENVCVLSIRFFFYLRVVIVYRLIDYDFFFRVNFDIVFSKLIVCMFFVCMTLLVTGATMVLVYGVSFIFRVSCDCRTLIIKKKKFHCFWGDSLTTW